MRGATVCRRRAAAGHSYLDEVCEAREHDLNRLLVRGREHGALLDEIRREVGARRVRVVLHAGRREDRLNLLQQVEVAHALVVGGVDVAEREHLHLTLVERHRTRRHERRAEFAGAHVACAERVEVREELRHADAASEDGLLEQIDHGLRVLGHVRVLSHRQPLGSAWHGTHDHHAAASVESSRLVGLRLSSGNEKKRLFWPTGGGKPRVAQNFNPGFPPVF